MIHDLIEMCYDYRGHTEWGMVLILGMLVLLIIFGLICFFSWLFNWISRYEVKVEGVMFDGRLEAEHTESTTTLMPMGNTIMPLSSAHTIPDRFCIYIRTKEYGIQKIYVDTDYYFNANWRNRRIGVKLTFGGFSKQIINVDTYLL